MSWLYLFAALLLLTVEQQAFSMTTSKTSSSNKGSAAKPYEKKKVVVFGAGGYLGGCIYGFLQRAGSLYGTGIAGIGAPRAIVATSTGYTSLNSVLSGNFVLAQAGESYVKLTDMTSIDSIQSKINGFDAAILGTRYGLETKPVTMGTFGKGPNDKTKEFYMDQSRGRSIDDPQYSMEIFSNTLEACKKTNKLRHLVVIETDSQFEGAQSVVGERYLQLLEEAQIPYTYIQPIGKFENINSFTYMKGIQSDLKISRVNSVEDLVENSNSELSDKNTIYREHVAAVCVQALQTLGWDDNRVVKVEQSSDDTMVEKGGKVILHKEWCVNSVTIQNSLAKLS